MTIEMGSVVSLPSSPEFPLKIGEFIQDYLSHHNSESPSIIHKDYKEYVKGFRTLKKKPYHVGTYHSFIVYCNGLQRAGLIVKDLGPYESTDPKGDPMNDPDFYQIRISLTDKGRRAPRFVWLHPLRLWHYAQDWEHDNYPEFVKQGAHPLERAPRTRREISPVIPIISQGEIVPMFPREVSTPVMIPEKVVVPKISTGRKIGRPRKPVVSKLPKEVKPVPIPTPPGVNVAPQRFLTPEKATGVVKPFIPKPEKLPSVQKEIAEQKAKTEEREKVKEKGETPPEETNIEKIKADLGELMDEDKKSSSIRRLKKALDGLDQDKIDVSNLETAIEDYEGLTREGMSSEEYADEKQSLFEGIEQEIEDLEGSEE